MLSGSALSTAPCSHRKDADSKCAPPGHTRATPVSSPDRDVRSARMLWGPIRPSNVSSGPGEPTFRLVGTETHRASECRRGLEAVDQTRRLTRASMRTSAGRTADMPVIHLVFRCTPLECDDPPRVPVARLCRSPRFNGGASALACRRRPGRRSTTGRRCAPPTRRSKGHWRGCDRAAGDQPGDMPSAARPRQ